MAGSPENCHAFLDRCLANNEPRRDADLKALQELKGGPLDPWDTAFYGRQIKESLGIDEEALKPHFEALNVVPKALEFLGEMLGLQVKQVESTGLWHESCSLYEVRQKGELVGHVVLDLFSRPGKFGHQMVVPLRPRSEGVAPVCCVLGNLGDEQKRLRFREVETVLHRATQGLLKTKCQKMR